MFFLYQNEYGIFDIHTTQAMSSILKFSVFFLLLGILVSCSSTIDLETNDSPPVSDVLNYIGTPKSKSDRSSLSFSDQGAWFSYGLPEDNTCGFSGPFLMTQSNGTWSSKCLSELELKIDGKEVDLSQFKHTTTSYLSHLENRFDSENLEIIQELFFASGKSSVTRTRIFNKQNHIISAQPIWKGVILDSSLHFSKEGKELHLNSSESDFFGVLNCFEDATMVVDSLQYKTTLSKREIAAKSSTELINGLSFLDQIDQNEKEIVLMTYNDFSTILKSRVEEKESQLANLNLNPIWADSIQEILSAKTILTLQNNWRTASGELKHDGVFPSYHYVWFHGFWAWDSWKHAAALAHINPDLAKDQIKAMYDYRTEDGFIPDCLFRDTTDESHNYRNTKAPLSAWAVYEVFATTNDTAFVKEMYCNLQLQHGWWYANRDHDSDGICEYGSTDGTVVAAKWESGMDNAVRFDNSKILKNKNGAYSLDQESVDLNAYLYAEKIYLSRLGAALNNSTLEKNYFEEARTLKKAIQNQFYDPETGWFYDTDLSGENFIKVMGCEGWIPLWANVATEEQANRVQQNMMDESKFNTMMPLQTLSADHPKFKPNRGYWRGPNWLDQSYFGVKGLYNYGFKTEAHVLATKLVYNAEGLIEKGPSIRENYQPITGAGLEAQNFSWSAAHYLLLLMEK